MPLYAPATCGLRERQERGIRGKAVEAAGEQAGHTILRHGEGGTLQTYADAVGLRRAGVCRRVVGEGRMPNAVSLDVCRRRGPREAGYKSQGTPKTKGMRRALHGTDRLPGRPALGREQPEPGAGRPAHGGKLKTQTGRQLPARAREADGTPTGSGGAWGGRYGRASEGRGGAVPPLPP